MAPSKVKVSAKEPEKFAPISMSPFKLMNLPLLKGVSGLSSSEIKDDLKELHPQSDDNDTDSDSSQMSEDILDSVYPVQPRSAPRTAADYLNMKYQDFSSSGNNASVDEALYLISDITKEHKELADKEKLREELELRCQAMDTYLDMEKDKFYSTRKEHENYLKLVQGLYARMVVLHGNYSRQNALLNHVHDSLAQQRQVEQLLSSESMKIKALSAASRNAQNGGKPAAAATVADDRSTPLLKVHLQKANVHVVLHVGLSIATPMGSAVISKILPEEQKLVLKLPFGLMFAHLPRAVSWCSANFTSAGASETLAHPHSVHGIQQHYRDTLQHRLTIPRTEASAIRSMLAQQHPSTAGAGDDDSGGTDNDEASAADSDGEDAASVSVAAEGAAAAPPGGLIAPQGQLQSDTAAAMETSETELEVTASKPGKAVPSYAEKDHVMAFPMPFTTSTVAPRTAAKKRLEAEVCENYPHILLQSLPLAFAPPSSLPYVASHLHSHPASGPTISASRILDVQYETHALQSLYHSFPATHNPQHHSHNGGAGSSSASATSSSCGGGSGSSAEGGVTVTLMTADGSAQQGATNSLAWQGNVKLLKSSLVSLGDEIKCLELEQQRKIAEIERLRHKSSALTTTATSIRLNMFTRRLAHRNTLGNLGIVLPPVVPVISHTTKARSTGQNPRNGGSGHNNGHSTNGNGTGGTGGDALAGAAALLLAASEPRSSRARRAVPSARNGDDDNGGRSMTQESFGAISAGGTSAVPGGMGLMRNSSLLRATTDSPFSTAHSLADEAPHSVDIAANQRRSRNNSAGTLKEDADAAASTAASNKRKPSGRRAADDIVASVRENDEAVGTADNDDNDSVGSKNGAGAANGNSGARKKPKRRRY